MTNQTNKSYNTLNLGQKLEIIQEFEDNKRLKAKFLAEKFSQNFGIKIPRRTISDILKNKEALKRKVIT